MYKTAAEQNALPLYRFRDLLFSTNASYRFIKLISNVVFKQY